MKQEDKPVTWIYQLGEDKALKETPKSHAGITQEVFQINNENQWKKVNFALLSIWDTLR